jgi:uncharacterized membrane protein affecting hemolysin expression
MNTHTQEQSVYPVRMMRQFENSFSSAVSDQVVTSTLNYFTSSSLIIAASCYENKQAIVAMILLVRVLETPVFLYLNDVVN